MIAIPVGAAIDPCTSTTDMRMSFDGLSGIVRSEFGRQPDDGSLFLFINRRRDRIKILYWENGGFALWYKRLEAGTFEAVTSSDEQSVVTIDATELNMLLSEVSLQSVNGEPDELALSKQGLLVVSYPARGLDMGAEIRSPDQFADALLIMLSIPNRERSVAWEDAQELIERGEVDSVYQSHSLDVAIIWPTVWRIARPNRRSMPSSPS